jgi:hypothetical protein
MNMGMRISAVIIVLLVAAGTVRADVAAPPTLCLDFLYLDAPYRYIVGVCMFAGAIGLGIWLRKRSVPWLVTIAIPLVLLVGTDIGLYIYGLGKQAKEREEYRNHYFQNNHGTEPGKPTKPSQQTGVAEKLAAMPKLVEE